MSDTEYCPSCGRCASCGAKKDTAVTSIFNVTNPAAAAQPIVYPLNVVTVAVASYKSCEHVKAFA